MLRSEPPVVAPLRVHFAYWGRRGGGARLALDLAREAVRHPALAPTFSVARSNVLLPEFEKVAGACGRSAPLLVLDTFDLGAAALTTPWRIVRGRRRLVERLRADRTQAVVTLMPHVWSPLVTPAIRRAGITYATIVHDAAAHPGDRTGLVHGWLMRDAFQADLVLTLSEAVATRLAGIPALSDKSLVTLFTPDMPPWREPVDDGVEVGLDDGAGAPRPAGRDGRERPFRLAFIGRILPYKGLPLLVEAVRIARARGAAIELGVYGEGSLGSSATALSDLGARVENRWQSDAELAAILARTDAVVLAHTEASQSGVAALAIGQGVPVIATPVGGLTIQVRDGETGVIADSATPAALADAILRLTGDARLRERITRAIVASRPARSCRLFLDRLHVVLRQQLER